MFAIAFDMNIGDLRSNYGEPYNNAYYEIKNVLRKYDFYNTQESVYLTEKNDILPPNLFPIIISERTFFATFTMVFQIEQSISRHIIISQHI